jgi:4'-phosphopantetheinyl transferase
VLAADSVHVWRADLTGVSDDLGDLLSPEENERAGRILNQSGRVLWVRAHGVLRALLGRYLDVDPRALCFATGERGKPSLVDARAALSAQDNADPSSLGPLSFNLTHSGALALYGFTRSGSIGIDVEVERRAVDRLAIAARLFGASEVGHLETLDPVAREREFLRLWTRHEAELKWRGTGVGSGTIGAHWPKGWIAELDVGCGRSAAVAAGCVPQQLLCWDWNA